MASLLPRVGTRVTAQSLGPPLSRTDSPDLAGAIARDGAAFRIEGIRAGRRKPGLLRQHLTAVQAAAEISGARVVGADIGSLALTFSPRAVVPGEYDFSIGTAGSAILVLQTVLPALLTASKPSNITLEGGTHNPAAPPFEFLERSFFPVINGMGPTVEGALMRHGFYPAGGGSLSVSVKPAPRLRALEILERGEGHNDTTAASVNTVSGRL